MSSGRFLAKACAIGVAWTRLGIVKDGLVSRRALSGLPSRLPMSGADEGEGKRKEKKEILCMHVCMINKRKRGWIVGSSRNSSSVSTNSSRSK